MRYLFHCAFLLSIILSSGFFSCNSNPKTESETTSNNSRLALDSSKLLLQKAIQLSNVKGGFDLMAIDVIGQRLFISAQEIN